ncbi:NADH-ubiquinone oxidoreductase 14.8 kDa subunit [Aspergillus terreus]|nr:NADH-ubiquinone oxidoreductase 14.8 kDa subunit [Aspergillus terreus]
MTINPTYLAQRTRSSNLSRLLQRSTGPMPDVVSSSRTENGSERSVTPNCSYLAVDELSPEIQTMYSLNMPVSAIRTKVRQEFEKHRYVKQLSAVDVLLFQSHAEFQETLNYWKQLSHVMKYFRPEEDPGARLPPNFISGFLEGRN